MTLSVICPKGILVEVLPGGGTNSSGYMGFLVGGGDCLALLHSPGEPFICEPVPLLKARAACFGKHMQAKGRRHSSLQLIGCSVTTRKRRRGGATKQLMGVCDKSVFTYKRGGGWGGLVCCSQDQVYFRGGKSPVLLRFKKIKPENGILS